MQPLESTYFSFENLEAYQLALDLVEPVYQIANAFHPGERFARTNQPKRAVNSIPLNIALGKGRGSDKDFARCFSRGSLLETVCALHTAQRLGQITTEQTAEVREQCCQLNSKLKPI